MENNSTVLVIGCNGQLGNECRDLSYQYPEFNFLFVDKEELSIDDDNAVKNYFAIHNIKYCINCAAYTAVDKAETDKEIAFLHNATALKNLAETCSAFNVQLIHISTDYVFDGTNNIPYKETDNTCPISVYGKSKLLGEEFALQNNQNTIIIRTSWVYSSYGNNFVKTMIRLMKERETLNVVSDQFGCPTYAADLAKAIMEIVVYFSKNKIDFSKNVNNIFNFCNEGQINWYQFAVAIKELTNSSCAINPITTDLYPTLAKRPNYSVLDTSLIKQNFNIQTPNWKDSLITCLSKLQA